MASWKDYIQPSENDAGKNAKKDQEKRVTKKQNILEGTLSVVPDCRYTVGRSLKLQGVGGVFSTTYNTKRVTHRVSKAGYTVEINVAKLLSTETVTTGGSAGSSDSKKDDKKSSETPAGTGTEKRDKASTKTAKESDYVTVNKITGDVTKK